MPLSGTQLVCLLNTLNANRPYQFYVVSKTALFTVFFLPIHTNYGRHSHNRPRPLVVTIVTGTVMVRKNMIIKIRKPPTDGRCGFRKISQDTLSTRAIVAAYHGVNRHANRLIPGFARNLKFVHLILKN